jgi:hypothetical protein
MITTEEGDFGLVHKKERTKNKEEPKKKRKKKEKRKRQGERGL